MSHTLRTMILGAACSSLLAFVGSNTASALTLADFGVTPGGTHFSSGHYANWTPGGGTNDNNQYSQTTGVADGVSYSIWDGYGPHGNGSHGDVSDFGGQRFDVKASYVTEDANNLYIGIVTSFNPAGLTIGYRHPVSYTLGDLALYSGSASGTPDAGILMPDHSSGSSGTTSLVVGGNWNVPNAAEGWGSPYDTNYKNGGTTVLTDIGYDYTDTGINYYDSTTHDNQEVYLLGLTVSKSELSSVGLNIDDVPFSYSFGLSCGNDVITGSWCPQPGKQPPVPEPASLLLLPLALAGWSLRRKRQAVA